MSVFQAASNAFPPAEETSEFGATPLTALSELATGVIFAGKISLRTTSYAVVVPADMSMVNVAVSPACAVDGLTVLLTVIVGSITVTALDVTAGNSG